MVSILRVWLLLCLSFWSLTSGVVCLGDSLTYLYIYIYIYTCVLSDLCVFCFSIRSGHFRRRSTSSGGSGDRQQSLDDEEDRHRDSRSSRDRSEQDVRHHRFAVRRRMFCSGGDRLEGMT
jgi:hypothetical protein